MNQTASWVLVLAAVAASVGIISVVDQGSHSVSDTLIGSAIYLIGIWAVTGLVLLVLRRRDAA
jgi:hypothetical protein